MIARIAVALAAAFVVLAPAAVAEPPVEPPNIGDLKTAARAYHDSGAYLTDLQNSAWQAIPWITERAPTVDRPAVVFDIDETSLSNYEALSANDFGRIPAGRCDTL